MIRICVRCKKNLGEKEPIEDKRITHTYCKPCKEKIEKEIDDYTVPESVVLLATSKINLRRW